MNTSTEPTQMDIGVLGTGIVGQTIAAMILPLWIRLFGVFQNPIYNFKVVR